MYEFTQILSSFSVPSGIDISQVDLSRVNPYGRALPPHQEDVLREILYIQDIIHDMIPTPLPGDDFELISNCLRSLETRTDLLWRIFDEVGLRRTLSSASGRKKDMIEEKPFSINHRLKALVDHWESLVRSPTKPERWDKESDITFIPPLIHSPSVRDHEETNGEDVIYKLSLTVEQSAAADKVYQKWLKDYKRIALYFKDHPPKPIGWVGVPTSEFAIRNGWATLLQDGVAQQPAARRLAQDKTYVPVYEAHPFPPSSWRTPGEVDQRTDEDRTLEWEGAKLERERRKARKALQDTLYRQL